MNKLKFAVCLALFVGILTLIIGFAREVGPATAFYRAAISFLIFACVGFLIASLAEKFLQGVWERFSTVEQQEEPTGEPVTSEDMSNNNSFSPLTADDFEHVARQKDG